MNLISRQIAACLGLLVATILGGCATSLEPPSVARVKLESSGSRLVRVERRWWECGAGPVAVGGYVANRVPYVDTTCMPLLVTVFDGEGHVLQRFLGQTEAYSCRHRMNMRSRYCIPVEPLPRATACLKVQVLNGPESPGTGDRERAACTSPKMARRDSAS